MSATIYRFPSQRRAGPPNPPTPGPPGAPVVSAVSEIRRRRAVRDLIARGLAERKAWAVVKAVGRSDSQLQRWATVAHHLGADGATDFLQEHALLTTARRAR